MNPLIQLKQTTSVFVVLLVFVCSALLVQIQAGPVVVPPPDGCYPAFTTAEGCHALLGLAGGEGNTGIGWYSLFSVGGGNFNTGVGAGTLALNTADSNTAVGTAAMILNTTGLQNTAIGAAALVDNTDGGDNTATGAFALNNNADGSGNTATGVFALMNTNGNANTATGFAALSSNSSGIFNTATGANALEFNTTGNSNIAIGDAAGINLTTGDNNIDIGNIGVAGESSTIRIGDPMLHTATFIAGILGQGPFGAAVSIDPSSGQLGVGVSSERFKKDINPMGKTSEALFSLKPVTFRYKNDKTDSQQWGLIAEEVAKVNLALIAVDKEGKPYSVRYDQVNAMLLNEFLKEHRTVQNLQNEIDALKAELREQKVLIQKVSAQLEVSKAAPQTVLNNQ